MTDRHILFSGPMVRALLDGSKTQTRRVLKPQPPSEARYSGIHYASDEPASWFFNSPQGPRKIRERYEPGDRLWVREAWKCEERFHAVAPRDLKPGVPVYYSADPDPRDSNPGCAGRQRAGMHMPRWASRLTLIVTDVRVQRLQEISEVDAIREGVTLIEESIEDPRMAFMWLWDSLNASRGFGWDANPWVCALTFTVQPQNIDQIGGTA
ncbi:hypothetical protein [uncultured Sphingomonas sp.]|uniref:hypothetical protein n=1 Tax=uncultured Sphingomonas sp. TaxID=158754 RepID=UPI0025F97666|nr:hypothetical protein [uncultured Sphingomonas sp.]